MGQSNAGERILAPRKTLKGQRDALENLVGSPLHDGAQCYVQSEEATYRFVKDSKLEPDGKHVVSPIGGHGRFIRESGPMAFAMLDGGVLDTSTKLFSGYASRQLVQFEEQDGSLIYVGRVGRIATCFGFASLAQGADLYLAHVTSQADRVAVGTVIAAAPGGYSCSAMLGLMPGDKLSLRARGSDLTGAGPGWLRVLMH